MSQMNLSGVIHKFTWIGLLAVVSLPFQSMASIPQPPEEKEIKTEETQENKDEEPGKTDTEKESDLEQEQGSPIVNEVEEMEADGN